MQIRHNSHCRDEREQPTLSQSEGLPYALFSISLGNLGVNAEFRVQNAEFFWFVILRYVFSRLFIAALEMGGFFYQRYAFSMKKQRKRGKKQ